MSFLCPICGYATTVYRTETYDSFVIRRRKCKNNPIHRDNTIELRTSEYMTMQGIYRNNKDIAELCERYLDALRKVLDSGVDSDGDKVPVLCSNPGNVES